MFRQLIQNISNSGPANGVSSDGRFLPYSKVIELADRLGEQISNTMKFQPGDLVFLTMPTSMEFVVAYLALSRLQAKTALVPTGYKQAEFADIFAGLRPDYVLANRGTVQEISKHVMISESVEAAVGEDLGIFELIRIKTGTGNEGIQRYRAEMPPFYGQTTLIKLTSGSSGRIKAVALSEKNIIAEVDNIVTSLGITGKDNILVPVPMYHSYGFDVGLLAALFSGANLIVEQNIIPRKIAQTIEQKDITIFLGVPNIYKFLIDTPFPGQPDFSSVRYLLSCTAPLQPEVIDAFSNKFGAVICQHYGSSETGAISNHVPEQVMQLKDAVGRPLNNVQVSIVDENGIKLNYDDEGEVVVSGPAVASGYLMADAADRARFKNGAYYTGDLGRINESGFITLTGRKDKIINVGGFKVSPQEVERVLLAHPAVAEAAVVGVKNRERQEIVYAGVTLKAEASETSLLDHCRMHLAEHKVPRRIEILAEMPKTATGKLNFVPDAQR